MSDKNKGIDKLGSTLQKQAQRTYQGNLSVCLELGTINGDLALVVPSLNNPIPHGDYMLCRQLTIGPKDEYLTITAKDGIHDVWNLGYPNPAERKTGTAEEHEHEVLIPETMRWIKPGDHVLVAWVGSEAVVIDLVYNSLPFGG